MAGTLTAQELAAAADLAAGRGATVEIVGCWVWARFTSKPAKETRDTLKAAGFHWNARRGLWQLAGRPSFHSKDADDVVRAKYGAVLVAAGAS